MPVMHVKPRILVRLPLSLTVAALLGGGLLAPGAASAACGSYFAEAVKRQGNVGAAPNQGPRHYDLTINSYQAKCGPNQTRISLDVIIDSRAFPYGAPFTFSVATKNNFGTWKRVRGQHGAHIFTTTGRQKIQEVVLYQNRTTSRTTRITQVRVRHCACSTSNGSLPIGRTLNAAYHPFYGPHAEPGHG